MIRLFQHGSDILPSTRIEALNGASPWLVTPVVTVIRFLFGVDVSGSGSLLQLQAGFYIAVTLGLTLGMLLMILFQLDRKLYYAP